MESCDRCGATAKWRYTLASGGVLTLCQHDAESHGTALVKKGAEPAALDLAMRFREALKTDHAVPAQPVFRAPDLPSSDPDIAPDVRDEEVDPAEDDHAFGDSRDFCGCCLRYWDQHTSRGCSRCGHVRIHH